MLIQKARKQMEIQPINIAEDIDANKQQIRNCSVESWYTNGDRPFITAHNSLLKTEGKLMVTNASKDLLSLFKAMRLDQHFSISGS